MNETRVDLGRGERNRAFRGGRRRRFSHDDFRNLMLRRLRWKRFRRGSLRKRKLGDFHRTHVARF